MDSVIFRHLDSKVAGECGYFHPKAFFAYLARQPQPQHGITRDTQVIYFPGSFGSFHEGHADVCDRVLKDYPSAKLVISPSNSDYTAEKYGEWSELASNKERYRRIATAMPGAIIDLEPMLNFDCDHNFTDLLEHFLNGQGLSIYKMRVAPIILAGKDRGNFAKLNDYTSRVKVVHYGDTTGVSTSYLPNKTRTKKHLVLRCNHRGELDLFTDYFGDQYESIRPIYLADELEIAREMIRAHDITHTICKEYARLLPYIPVSRTFEHPLADPIFPRRDERFNPAMVILDSDIYSGSTSNFIQRQGCDFLAVFNYLRAQNTHELLDISDFRKPDFAYPFVDISSRCSMQAFDYNFHVRFDNFKAGLMEIAP